MIGVVAASAQTEVVARLDSASILIGEQTNLTVSVKARQGAKIVFPVYRSKQLLNSDLEVVSSRKDTLEQEDGQQTITCTYTLTGWNSKKATVPSLNVEVDGKNFSTKAIPLRVDSLRVYIGKQTPMQPADDVKNNLFSWGELLPCLGWSVFAVLLLVLAYYLHLRLRDNKSLVRLTRVKKPKLPHERALDNIKSILLKAEDENGDQKTYYTQLTDVLRQYLEDRFDINAKEMTTAEILSQLRKEDDRDKMQELKEVLETSDLVKFAKYSTQVNEKTMYLNHVVKFIEDTKTETIPHQKSEEDKAMRLNRRSRMTIKLFIAALLIASVALLTYVIVSVYSLMN